ncbi:MAG TPA: hypothetical protein VFT85_00795 [Acidimicrobiia bacterium]|nr:hypothetical protein [Acidimicrobiia bacterium]
MRSRRLSFVAGWAAVALLAAAGFATFGTPDAEGDSLQAEAAANSIGHTAGAYAGLNFALVGENGTAALAMAVVAEEDDATAGAEGSDVTDEDGAGDDTAAAGTIASPSSGWLSEVEVRALVELYFEPQDVNRAVRIAWCESRFDPGATDLRTGGIGLFNHLPRYWDDRASNAGFAGVAATDAQASTAAAAWEVYNGAGWEIFNCR